MLGSRPLRRPGGRSSPRLAALLAAVAAAVVVPLAAWPATAPQLRAQADELRSREASLRASASRALLELYAAQSALDRARAEHGRLEQRAAALAAEETSARLRTRIVRRSAVAARRRVHDVLRTLYVEGDVDPIAVILGATSLDEALEGLDGLSRAARRTERLVDGLRASAARLQRLRVALVARRRSADAARVQARAAVERLAWAVGARQSALRELRRRADLTAQEVDTLERRAVAASAVSARITAPPPRAPARAATAAVDPSARPVPPPAPPVERVLPAPGATRTLLVDAVAYYLPGRTASGLPVGPGVIAVDPSVIPLGTRVYVPGYGPAVAADTGSAIVGPIIDLWMPSTARARAWGRRTVTITVYG